MHIIHITSVTDKRKLLSSNLEQGTTGSENLFSKLKIGQIPTCQCRQAHPLSKSCSSATLRYCFWPDSTTLTGKLFKFRDLTQTARFVKMTGLQMWRVNIARMRKKEKA
ncbi:hypothetical protein ElyMa_000484100 [Elysia marginata]|uniref:Uncharacterized protein n=1 Tax=Elysia marginata TaxID=1093978 RepID=A0AAV4FTV0_9GAST|nr:hypothetical protein ElyMa_000484100 [Elysia marginata]